MPTHVAQPSRPHPLKVLFLFISIAAPIVPVFTGIHLFDARTDLALGLILLSAAFMFMANKVPTRWFFAINIMFITSSLFVPQGLQMWAAGAALLFFLFGIVFLKVEK